MGYCEKFHPITVDRLARLKRLMSWLPALFILLHVPFAAAGTGSVTAGEQGAPQPLVYVSGLDRPLVGRVVRGFNLGRGMARPQDADYFVQLSRSGANVARALLVAERDPSGSAYRIPKAALDEAETNIERAESSGLQIVVGLTLGGDERGGAFWKDSQLQSSFIANWVELAKRFKGRKGIIAFDLLNEPIEASALHVRVGSKWSDVAIATIAEIRKYDPDRTVVYQPAPGGIPKAFDSLERLPFDGVVYSIHFYFPMELTHQFVEHRYDRPVSYPSTGFLGKRYDKQALLGSLKYVTDFSMANKVPIYVGEFSCVRWAPGNSAQNYIRDSIDIFEQNGWSWTYHEWRGWTGWDAENPSHDTSSHVRDSAAPTIELLRNAFRKNGN